MAEREPGVSFEEHLREFFRDPALGPVVAVVTIIIATFGAAMIIFALEQRNVFALAALAITLVASGHAVVSDLRRGAFGLASRAVLVLWVASALVAAAFVHIGAF